MRIGITGVRGLIGWHARCFFTVQPDVTLILADRGTFADFASLRRFVSDCDSIIHLAGMNRGAEEEIASVNLGLAEMLIEACRAEKCLPHIVFASSTHIFRNTRYGDVKRHCSEIFRRWSRDNDAVFTNLILPNVFGENGRPFYNSVVSTFCHQLARGETPKIEVDAVYDYIHCHEVALNLQGIVQNKPNCDVLVTGRQMSVGEILEKLTDFNNAYRAGVIPDCRDRFDLALFNTYRSQLYPAFYPHLQPLSSDSRGYLFEAVKSNGAGQCFISTTSPGITRGNHFHFHKVERFCVLSGKAVIRVRRLFDDHVESYAVNGREPCFIDMPTLHTHNITNTGTEDVITLFWANEIFDPSNPDTFGEMVDPE